MRYTVIIERTKTGYSAYPPDLPGVGATGRTLASVRKRVREAIAIHIEGLKEDGLAIPRPTVLAEHVDVNAA